MGALLQDVRFAARTLRTSPLFTTAAIVSLALGIGANTAVYALMDALFMRPPAGIVRGDELVAFHQVEPRQGWWEFASYPDYVHYRDHNAVFSGLASHFGFTGVDTAAAAEIPGSVVSENFFSVLGITPHVGRFFERGDDEVPDRNFVIVLSHRLWQRRCGGNPQCVGRPFVLNGVPLTVIGVAPPAFQGAVIGASDDVWIPNMIARVAFRQMNILSRGSSGDQSPLRPVGRLKPGLTIDAARTDLMVLARQLHSAFPDQHPWSEVSLYPLNGIDPHHRSEHSRLIVVLGTTATMMLVIACANLAALLLSRGLQRRKEIATRFALGAGRRRVIRQFLTESIALALVGGLAGLLVASWFVALLENHYPLPLDLHIDRRTAAFNTLLAVVAGLAFGLVPAVRTSRLGAVRIQEAMASPSITRSLLWSAFVVLQIGLSVVLVAGAGLLIQSRAALMGAPGFDPSNVLYLQMKPNLSGYDAVKERAYFVEVQRRLASLAGVQSIAFAFRPPLRGQELPEVSVSLPGDESATPERALRVKQNIVSPFFFETLAIPIRRGRGFEPRDLETARPVVVVNDVLARRLWPDREATGQTLLVAGKPHDVAGIVQYDNFRRSGEAPAPFLFRTGQAGNRMLVRVARDPEAMLPLLRREIRAIDPGVAITIATPFASVLQDSFTPVTLTAIALGSAGGIAVGLTVLGLYGVLAVAVAQRTREIGIRMALGANARAVVTMVIRDGTRLLIAGLALGTSWAVVSAGRLSDYLYGVTGRDPLTLATAAIVLAAVGLLACYLPARYAAGIDPVRTLRSD